MKLRNLLPVLFGFFIMGFCDIVGVATSYVKTEFGLSESLAGLIPSMVFLWFLILSVPTSLLCRRFGRRKMVIAGNLITVAGMLIPLLLFTFPACLAAFALLGIGNTILQVALNPLLTDVVDGKALSSSLTAGQVIKAVSSFSGPFIVTFAVAAWGDWKMMFPVFAVLSVISAAWLALAPIKEKTETGSTSVKSVFALINDRFILMLFMGIVCIVGVDVGINTLAPKILMERCSLPMTEAGFGSSIYFLCRVGGAFIGTVLLAKISDRKYYISHLIIGIAVVVSMFAVKDSKITLMILLGAAGYAFSSIFSVIYSQALKYLPEKADEISGLMITGVFGGALVPPLMGVFSDLTGSQTGSIIVIAAFALYLLVCGLKLNKA